MRFVLPLTAALLLAGCASGPQTPGPATPSAPAQQPVQRGGLIGFSVEELGARFGQPSFQVREGPGLKLQWAVPACILDTYLYPPPSGAGVARVTFVEARRPDGNPTDPSGCIAAIDAAG